MGPQFCIGVEIGETDTTAGIVNLRTGAVTGYAIWPTPPRQAALLAAVADHVQGLLASGQDIDGLGVSVSGLGRAAGVSPRGVQLESFVHERFGLAARVAGAADCLAWGEARFGAGHGFQHLLGLRLGTSFEVGTIIHGELHQGAHGSAGQLSLAPFRDGRVGDYVSAEGLRAILQRRLRRPVPLRELSGLLQQATPTVDYAWREYGRTLAEVLTPVLLTLDPELLVLGGDIGAAMRHFLPAMRRELVKRLPVVARQLDVRMSALKHVAGVVGAAALWLRAPGEF